MIPEPPVMKNMSKPRSASIDANLPPCDFASIELSIVSFILLAAYYTKSGGGAASRGAGIRIRPPATLEIRPVWMDS